MIESLFKRNKRVISAAGEIKSVDFFIDDFPINLKVTFFPNQYMECKLKEILGKNSFIWLKNKAKALNITADKKASLSQQIYTIKEKLYESGHTDIIDELKYSERSVIQDAMKNPIDLMRWLYENQGEMRFGAENRIFIILADTDALDQSWKLKRAFDLIEPVIEKYLKSFTGNTLKHIDFQFRGSSFKSLADTIFIIR